MGTEVKTLSPREQARLFALPPFVLAVVRSLHAAGHGAWICGGTARDLLAGRLPDDYDVATDARPPAIDRTLAREWFEAQQPGAAWGSFALHDAGTSVELTALRREGAYSDGRKPDEVWFTSDVGEDCRRRDFTVNALYIDPRAGTLLDPTGGLADLENGRLACIGPPEERLRQDSLRVLRALRQCAELGLVMDAATWAGVRAAAPLVAGLSSSRVVAELTRLFVSPGRARGLMLLVRSGVADLLLPQLAPLAAVPQPEEFHPEGDVLRHTALVLAHLREPVDERLAWAAVFHDLGKKETFTRGPDRIRFDGHDMKSADHARAWLERHAIGGAFAAAVLAIVEQHIRIASVPSFRPAKRNRFLADPLFPLHREFHRADCLASHAKLDLWEELGRLHAALPPDLPQPLLQGRDLLARGMRPGPAIGRLLKAVEEARYEGTVRTRDEALRFVENLDSADSG